MWYRSAPWAVGYATHYWGKPFRDHSAIVESFLMVSYGTNITSVSADRALTAAVAATEYDLGECMEVCKRENARSDDDNTSCAHPASTARVLQRMQPADSNLHVMRRTVPSSLL